MAESDIVTSVLSHRSRSLLANVVLNIEDYDIGITSKPCQLGTEAAIESKAQGLAEKHGYAWKPSREWVQRLKQARLGIVKRRYRSTRERWKSLKISRTPPMVGQGPANDDASSDRQQDGEPAAASGPALARGRRQPPAPKTPQRSFDIWWGGAVAALAYPVFQQLLNLKWSSNRGWHPGGTGLTKRELTDRGLRYTKEEMGGHFQTLMDDMVRRGIVPPCPEGVNVHPAAEWLCDIKRTFLHPPKQIEDLPADVRDAFLSLDFVKRHQERMMGLPQQAREGAASAAAAAVANEQGNDVIDLCGTPGDEDRKPAARREQPEPRQPQEMSAMGGGGGAGPSVSVAEPPIERKRGPTDMGVDARAAAKPRVEVKEEGKEEEKNGSTQRNNGQEGRGRQEERGRGGGAAAAGGGGGADGAEEALNEEIRAVVAELVDTRNEDPHMNTAVTALLKPNPRALNVVRNAVLTRAAQGGVATRASDTLLLLAAQGFLS